MLQQVAEGVLIHTSAFMQSNAVVVQGHSGVLLIDPGIQDDDMGALAHDLRALGQTVVAGFATHPHWDHLLWHATFGDAPRYATAQSAAVVRALLSDPGWQARVAARLPPDIAAKIPLDLFGRLTGLPPTTAQIPWAGPHVRIIAHQAHAPGHAALLIAEQGVLVAGDMLSDSLIPLLNVNAAEPIADYLAALGLFAGVADAVAVLIPGHGSVGDTAQFRARIAQDRAYVESLRDGHGPRDPRLGPSAPFGKDWLPGVHDGQRQQLAQKRGQDGTRG